jgi:DNA adenine methylase
MDGEVVNVFRVLRNYVQAAELERLLRLTPFARDEFQAAYEPSDDPVELARRTIVRSFMGFGSAAINTKHRTGFRGRSFRSGTSPANDWRNYPDAMRHYETRLQGVAIESRPALELIQAQDRADVLFYVDPPYPRDTRYGADCYRYEMNDDDHREMAEILRHAKGMVVVSGYSCPLYDEIFRGWRSVSTPWFADGARARTECLWISPNAIDNAGLLALAE